MAHESPFLAFLSIIELRDTLSEVDFLRPKLLWAMFWFVKFATYVLPSFIVGVLLGSTIVRAATTVMTSGSAPKSDELMSF